MASAVQTQFSKRVSDVTVEEAEIVGTFDVFAGDELVYSKQKTGRLPLPGEVEEILFTRLK